jgi:hypothetical protein
MCEKMTIQTLALKLYRSVSDCCDSRVPRGERSGCSSSRVHHDHRARGRALLVEDVDRRSEDRPLPGEAGAFEHVTEELVHLAAHSVEVGERIAS